MADHTPSAAQSHTDSTDLHTCGDSASAAYTAEGETLDALRESLLTMMSDWSEENWAAGWMSRTEEMLHEKGGTWEVLGRAVGWPTGYEGDPDFRWVTWDEAGCIFEKRKAARAAR
jgi:hypothetical protein